jgi:hypothetical protein
MQPRASDTPPAVPGTGSAVKPAQDATSTVIELAYGLLWAAPVDTRTPNGLAVSLARRALLALLDRAGQARGIAAARAAIAIARSPKKSLNSPSSTKRPNAWATPGESSRGYLSSPWVGRKDRESNSRAGARILPLRSMRDRADEGGSVTC